MCCVPWAGAYLRMLLRGRIRTAIYQKTQRKNVDPGLIFRFRWAYQGYGINSERLMRKICRFRCGDKWELGAVETVPEMNARVHKRHMTEFISYLATTAMSEQLLEVPLMSFRLYGAHSSCCWYTACTALVWKQSQKHKRRIHICWNSFLNSMHHWQQGETQ